MVMIIMCALYVDRAGSGVILILQLDQDDVGDPLRDPSTVMSIECDGEVGRGGKSSVGTDSYLISWAGTKETTKDKQTRITESNPGFSANNVIDKRRGKTSRAHSNGKPNDERRGFRLRTE